MTLWTCHVHGVDSIQAIAFALVIAPLLPIAPASVARRLRLSAPRAPARCAFCDCWLFLTRMKRPPARDAHEHVRRPTRTGRLSDRLRRKQSLALFGLRGHASPQGATDNKVSLRHGI
jgi:hypothetical protein